MGWKEESRKDLKSRNEGNTFKFAEGENIIRILPNKRGLGESGYVSKYSPFLIFATHPNVGPQKRFARCGKDKDGNGECWLCDTKIPKLEQSDKEGLQKKADAMKARDQVLFQVAYLDSDIQKWRGPKPLYLGLGKKKALGNRLVSFISTSSKREYEHPLKGYNILIERSGSGLDTVYSDIQAEDDPSKVKDYILNKLQSFGELIGKYSAEGQEALYLGKEVQEEEGEGDEETPKPKPGKKPKPEEDEGEGNEADESGDEGEAEEDDKPKPKPGKKPKKPEPEEDEGSEETEESGDEGEGEEEESPKPKPGKKPKKPEPEEEEEEGSGDEGEGEEEGEGAGDEAEEEEEMARPKPKPGKKPKKSVEKEEEEE